MKRLGCAFLCLALSGCGLTPFGSDALDTTTTGSIAPVPATTTATSPVPPSAAPSPVVASLDPSDWEAIRAVSAERLATAGAGSEIDWTNPDTGNSGTIAPLAAMRPQDGLSCRPFVLTVSDVRGVRRYQASACRGEGGWQLHDVTADDKALL
ncbi:RT0821/Lpp0805 family surface protein [Kaistia geumhonensis]|uniref:Surface antigen n=1 Tax=Kaistia geumhonensis TaxID=410839 RepID=A0ABU0MBQ9_9HYPH|nr:RT0821/Lpp0805 family surface protein [Kaistia geumhonensis]MCX5481174.1 RT0821/Lpp0805 family surface protein [Kaistia geumhonensis]MDQ0518235.1 surface antigen [Kaistia geumhonensis]